MPPEPLPFDRKDFFKERKPSSSEPVGIVPGRWRELPTTPSSHQNHGSSSSYRWGGGGGSCDVRRPFSGHGKQVGGGWHVTTVEPGPREDKYCRNDSSRENSNNNSRGMAAFSCQKDRKGGNSWETPVSPNGNSHPHSDFVNSWDQLQSKDQHDKNNDGGLSNPGVQRLEKENSLGSSIDWKPLKWIRSGSLSSRGSGFSNSSSSKSIGVDSLDTKVEAQPGNSTPLQSPSGDAAPCLTPRTPADEANSRKKPRLGWGEGLAKYEKKKVGPDDIVDKEVGARNGMVDGVCSSEPLIPNTANLPDKSPSLTGCSECASPATPYSFACSSSPGVEEKASIKAATADSDICNPSVPSCHLSQNQTEESPFNLENLELTGVINLSSSLNELLQSNDTNALCSGFVRSTAMDKLQVWKADISRTLEITETEIDSLENELKSLISNVGGSCPFPSASSSLPTECNNKYTEETSRRSPLRIISSRDTLLEKADGSIEERNEVEDLDRESPGTATSKFMEPLSLCNNVTHSDAVEESDSPVITEAKCSQDHVGDETICRDGSLATISVGGDVHYGREDKLCDLILASNKVLANRASDEFSKLLPTSQWYTDISRATNELVIKEKFATRKRFMKFKERVVTLKFRAFQYLWKEDLRLLSIRRFGAKPQRKFELSSRMGYTDYQKQRSSIRSRFSSPAGNLSLVPTTEIIDYANKLLSDSRVRIYRNALKMPSLILDKRERTTSRFVSDNGLVENPLDVEKEKSVINPWTSEEKQIFLDRFSLFGKDFKKIASFLEHKTIADCVEFYYKNHKSDRFQKTKKNPEFAKQGKSYSTNTYLVTSGKRWNRETNAASLDMLGAASAMADSQRKCTSKFYIGTSSERKPPQGDNSGILERSNSLATLCNERETVAADVLAGICGSISSEALSSCITSLVDHGDVYHKLGGSSKRRLLTPEPNDVDDETCSDDSCGGETDSSDWTDEEKLSFVQAVAAYGKDFSMISRCMRTRSRDQCKVFFSKARKCLELDIIHHGPGSEGTMDGANQGGGSDHDDTCMVDSGSGISCDKSSSEFKMDIDDLHSSDQNVTNDCREPEVGLENLVSGGFVAENNPEVGVVAERASNGNLEEAADLEEPPRAKGEGSDIVAEPSVNISREEITESEHQLPDENRFDANTTSIDHRNGLELNTVEKPRVVPQAHDNGLSTSNLFSQDPNAIPHRKTFSQDDISSRLSFRKSSDRSQRSSSTDGYHLHHLPKRSLLDCVDSSQIIRGYPVTVSTNRISGSLGYNDPQSKFKLDDNLLPEHCLPRDCSLQMCTTLSQEPRPSSSSSDVEKPTRSGDVKLFGQILTNPSPQQPKANGSSQKSFNLKFEKNLPLRSYGFWDGNRIKTSFQSLPDSAMLLAKYPAAFSNVSTSTKLEPQVKIGNEQRALNVGSGFHNSNYNGYRSQEAVQVQPYKLDGLSNVVQQQGRGMVGMACNGVVSDPVAAIRMHYAKTEQLKRSNGGGGDIGSR